MVHRLQTITRVMLMAVAAASLAACGQSPTPGSSEAQSLAAGDHYTTRGIIIQTPNPTGHVSGLTIRHEAVPNFKTQTGGTTTMEPMAMPFPLAPGVSAAGLKAGDKIRFTFSVNWKTNDTGITSIHKLPANTKLDFSKTAAENTSSAEKTMSQMSHSMGEATTSP